MAPLPGEKVVLPMGRPPKDPAQLAAYLVLKAARAAMKPPRVRSPKAKAAKPKSHKAEQVHVIQLGQPANPPAAQHPPAVSQGKKLTVADLPAIIELFKTIQITRLTGEGFDLQLTPKAENRQGGELKENPGVSTQGSTPAPRHRIDGARADAEEVAMAQKLVDDPLAFEQAQIDAHLGRNNDESSGDDDSDDGRELF